MPCDIPSILAASCVGGIGSQTDEIGLLQFIAQNALAWAQASNPSVDYSLGAVQDRMCDSGIGRITDEIELYRNIAQSLCSLTP